MGPYTFQVTTDPAFLEAAATDGRVAGFSTLEGELIGVSNAGRSHVFQADTLLHEIIHMAYRVSGFQFTEHAEEERAVLAVTTPVLDALRENPALAAFLTHKE